MSRSKLSDNAKDLAIGIALGGGISGIIAGVRNDPSSLAGDIVGATGQEVIEYGVKRQLGKQTTGILAKEASKKATQKAAQVVGTKIAETAVRTTITTSIKTAGTIGGRLASSSLALMGGPIGLAILLISLTLGLLDIFWNPWKNYFNKDLNEILDQLNEEAVKQYRLQGKIYPLEHKPVIEPQTEKEWEDFQKDVKQYFIDRNLVYPVAAFVNVKNRVDDYSQNRMRKMAISDTHMSILSGAKNKFQNKTFVDNFNELSDITNSMRAKNEFADKMTQYVYLRMTNEDIQTERTTLLLYTSLLYKKGYILPPSERNLWVNIRQYLEVYWFRIIFYFLSIVVSVISCCLVVFFIK